MPVWVAPKNGVLGDSESLINFHCHPVVPLLRAMSFPPSQSPARAAASPSLAEELERRLDLNLEDDFTLVQQPSVISSLAQFSAHGGVSASASRGEYLSSLSTPRDVLGGGCHSVPVVWQGALRVLQQSLR